MMAMQNMPAKDKRGRPKGQATQIIYKALRDEILTLVLKPGQYLEERMLEKRFGVSRTPIREALIRLQENRLVRFSANRGHYVEIISFNDVPKIFEALDLQQAAVLQLAALRHQSHHIEEMRQINNHYRQAAIEKNYKAMAEFNHDFHLVTAAASGNSFLAEFYETMLNFSIRLSYLMFQTASQNAQDFEAYYMRVFNDHNEMIRLIETGEATPLRELSRRHTQLFSDRAIRFLAAHSELDASIESFSD